MPRRKTTDEFIADSKEVHGDKYDYSKVEYVNSATKVTIICPDHGDFEQIPNNHLHGWGCSRCSGCHKFTTEEFIAEARKVHGDKYDYSKVEYVNSKIKIIITCPAHGDFEQAPSNHLRQRQGCPDCATETKRKTTEEFKVHARAVHGNKYDYSKVEYVNSKTKVIIICPDHGGFEQRTWSHLEGQGCPHCAIKAKKEAATKTTEEFIAEARKVHGDKYDYSKVEYVNSNTKVIITCPEHGDFEQRPSGHLRGSQCLQCAIEAATKTTEQFITDSKEVHGDKYDYSKVEYENNRTKVTIICSYHGTFEQLPSMHLVGTGCPDCAHESSGLKQRKTTEQFIADAKEVHGDKYDYSKVQYAGSFTKVIITCPEHGDFEQVPSSHLQGHRCPVCAESFISEPIFRKVLEEITSLKFPKKKPKWLRNPNTNRLLELDCYNQKSKIAFELQGEHHYGPIEHWGGEEKFQKVFQRDQIKKTICEKKGIHLFCIDQRPASRKTPQEKEEYYKKEIKKCLQQLPQHVKIRMNRR